MGLTLQQTYSPPHHMTIPQFFNIRSISVIPSCLQHHVLEEQGHNYRHMMSIGLCPLFIFINLICVCACAHERERESEKVVFCLFVWCEDTFRISFHDYTLGAMYV